MATTDSKQTIRAGRTPTAVPPAPAFPPERLARSLPPILEPEVEAPARRARDGVSATLTFAALVVLAGVLAAYVVMPAVRTLADASATTWSGDGP